MSRLMITSDLHLGHRSICKYRPNFKTPEEHNETLFENLASNINKRDSLVMLGDIAFTREWLMRLKEIDCVKKTLVLGNHDTDRSITILDLAEVFDSVHSLWAKRNMWFTHCPMHPMELRGKKFNIHGHLHYAKVDDPRYINVCVEHTDWKPISFDNLMKEKLIGET